MKYVISLIVLSAMTTAAMAADPKPSQLCWEDGSCLSDSFTPITPVEPAETRALRPGELRRPYYQPPIFYIQPPVVLTPTSPPPSVCYVLNNGIYSPLASCPPVQSLPRLQRRR